MRPCGKFPGCHVETDPSGGYRHAQLALYGDLSWQLGRGGGGTADR